MGMITYVEGLVSPENEEYKKHSAVLKACIDAGIKKLPEETALFFGESTPEKYLFEDKLKMNIPVKEWKSKTCDTENGYELKVSEIPKEVETIRFVNSY